MEGKVFSIPFRQRTGAGDYTCRDGEVESASNVVFSSDGASGSGTADSSGDSPDATLPPAPGSSGFSPEYPPAPIMEFALKKSVLPGWHNHPDRFPSAVMERGEESAAGWGVKAMDMLSALGEAAAKGNLFIHPFLAICALRLNDGSRILPSQPVLMVPNSEPPLVAGDSTFSRETMEMKAVAAVCRLQYRLTLPESISAWTDRIESIDIMVSAPIPLYDSKAAPLSLHNAVSASFSHSIGTSGTAMEHRLSADSFPQAWLPEPAGDTGIYRALTNISSFYVVSSIPLNKAATSETFADVAFNSGSFFLPQSFETYTPDYAHRKGIHAAWQTVFSGRTTLCDLTLTLPEAAPPASMTPFSSGVLEDGASPVAIEVTVRKNGKTLKSVSCGNGAPDMEIGDGALPRWLFYPDPDATEITIISRHAAYTFPLRRHPSLHGAFFWCGGFGETTAEEMGITQTGTRLGDNPPDMLTRDSYRLPAAVWRSAKGNSLLFPDSLLMELDVDRAIAICRAFRSSGLVATTAPTAYLFTSSGIFLLREMDDGSLRDAGLIGSYVLRDSSSFSIRGSSVEFTTDSGNILTIEGTVIKDSATTVKGNGTSSGVTVIRGDGSGKPAEIVTRPIKFGDPEAFKRIASVALRGNFPRKSLSLKIHGSRDLHGWKLLAETDRSEVSGIWSSPVRYIKVTATLPLSPSETLEAIAVRTI